MSALDSARRKKSHWFLELVLVVVVALVVAAVIRAFVAQAFFIPSGSMEDTLLEDDWILVSKVGLWWGDVDRGDVVVFKDPGGWLTTTPSSANPVRRGLEFIGVAPSSSEGDLVKRVIGVGGDTVECCDDQGQLLINGIAVDEPNVYPSDEPGDAPAGCQQKFTTSVPAGYLWVMGDHRSVSEDSRCHEGLDAFVPEDDVIGRAVLIFLPVGRWELIDQPAVYAEVDPS